MWDENNLIFFRKVFPPQMETFETIANICRKKKTDQCIKNHAETAKLAYLEVEDRSVRLIWVVSMESANQMHNWSGAVDAMTGDVLQLADGINH